MSKQRRYDYPCASPNYTLSLNFVGIIVVTAFRQVTQASLGIFFCSVSSYYFFIFFLQRVINIKTIRKVGLKGFYNRQIIIFNKISISITCCLHLCLFVYVIRGLVDNTNTEDLDRHLHIFIHNLNFLTRSQLTTSIH